MLLTGISKESERQEHYKISQLCHSLELLTLVSNSSISYCSKPLPITVLHASSPRKLAIRFDRKISPSLDFWKLNRSSRNAVSSSQLKSVIPINKDRQYEGKPYRLCKD